MRKRLNSKEADLLGLVKKNKTKYGHPKYTITSEQYEKVKQMRSKNNAISPFSNFAKILIFDIETAPSMGYVWSKWQQNIHDDQLINEWFMLTWSAKWLFEDKVYSGILTPNEAIEQNDLRIVQSIWQMLDDADIVVGHNIEKFDIRKLNARFLIHGLGTPSSFQTIDTLKHARKRFSLHSNKLNYLATFLGLESKASHEGFSMWDKCYKGDEESLRNMSLYNDRDVCLNEEVYLELRPFIKPHPNVALFIDDNKKRCTCCGSDSLLLVGEYHTTSNKFPEYKCNSCGHISRGRKAEKRGKNLLSSLPR